MYQKAQHDLAVLQKQLGPNDTIFPAIAQAKASIHTDLYNLGKTVVRAPASGIITNDYLLPGAIVGTGTPLFALVEPSHFWVIGRYKEGALQHIHVGEQVSVYLKMYGWKKFTGTVSDIGYGVNRRQASNAVVNSSLPYLEQTEDWIQLQQRFPVTIKLDTAPSDTPYRVGASARIFIHR
jgi:multidrug resistance efflux pump